MTDRRLVGTSLDRILPQVPHQVHVESTGSEFEGIPSRHP